MTLRPNIRGVSRIKNPFSSAVRIWTSKPEGTKPNGLSKLLGLAVCLWFMTFSGACTVDRFSAAGWSGMTLHDGALYVGTGSGTLLSLDPNSGATNWAYPDSTSGEGNLGLIYAPPVAVEDRVYFGTYEVRSEFCDAPGEGGVSPCGRVYGIKAGETDSRQRPRSLWVYPGLNHVAIGTLVSGPVISDDILVIASSDGSVYALDAETGNLQWQFVTEDRVWSRPTVDQGVVYFGSMDHKLYAVGLKSGELIWEFETDGSITASPLIVGERLYFGSFDRWFYSVDLQTGGLIWKTRGDQWFWAGGVSSDGIVYAATLGGSVYAFDPEDGNLLWFNTVTGAVVVPPFVFDDKIGVVTDKGFFTVFQGNTGAQEWGPNLGDFAIRAPVVLNEDLAYISGSDGFVRVVNVVEHRIASQGNRDLWEIQVDD